MNITDRHLNAIQTSEVGVTLMPLSPGILKCCTVMHGEQMCKFSTIFFYYKIKCAAMQKWSFTFGSMVITDKPLKLSMEKVTLYVKYYL